MSVRYNDERSLSRRREVEFLENYELNLPNRIEIIWLEYFIFDFSLKSPGGSSPLLLCSIPTVNPR